MQSANSYYANSVIATPKNCHRMKKVVFLFALLCSGLIQAQDAYSLSYNGYRSEILSSASDSNKLALVNLVTSLTSVENNYIISLIENGSPIWNKRLVLVDVYPTSIHIGIEPITANVIVYYTALSENGTYVNICKLSADSGQLLWSKKVSIPPPATGNPSIFQNIENICISEDQTIHIALSLTDHLRYLKLSGNGDLLLSKRINNIGQNSGKNSGFCITQCPDSSYLVSMKFGYFPTVARFNPDFTVVWSQKWTIESLTFPNVIQQLSNGKVVVTGFGDGSLFIAVMNNANGNIEKYLKSANSYHLYGAVQLIELDDNRLLLATDYNIYYVVNLASDEWKEYTTQHMIRFEKTTNGICAILENNLNFGLIQVIPDFDPENPECVVIKEINEGAFAQLSTSNAVTNAFPFYFAENSEIDTASFQFDDYEISNSLTCILETSTLIPFSFDLFPNPVSKEEWITIETNQIVHNGIVILSDLTGKTLNEQPIDGMQAVIKTSNLSAGMYLVHVMNESDRRLLSKRVVVR